MLTSYYIPHVQRQLHDTSASFWSTTQLTDYINEARNVVAGDTGCGRTIITFPSVVEEEYQYSSLTLPTGYNGVLDILRLSAYVSGSTGKKIELLRSPWAEFDAEYRNAAPTEAWPPTAWATYGQSAFYVSPVPTGTTYTFEADAVLLPAALVNDSSVEVIAYPYYRLVEWYAAFLAKHFEQKFQDAQYFMKIYEVLLAQLLRTTPKRHTQAVLPPQESSGVLRAQELPKEQ